MNEENVIEINNYDGIQLDEYNGKYSLNAMQHGQNDVWYKRWVFLSRYKDGEAVPDKKKQPMKVVLGDKSKALEVLKHLYNQINRG